MRKLILPGVVLALCACGPDEAEMAQAPAPADDVARANDRDLPPIDPPAPGEPGGLPDDRTPLDEGPIDPDSAEGAGQVLQSYWALVEQGRYDEAYDLWSGEGEASGISEADFAASFDRYSEVHAMIGAPGESEGAAGSLYVEYPVQVYGRMADEGSEFNMLATMVLRRANDVPGATPEQLEWRIYSSDVSLPQ
jgi:hypothetical protein